MSTSQTMDLLLEIWMFLFCIGLQHKTARSNNIFHVYSKSKWSDANDSCVKHGGMLAIINTIARQQDLNAMLKDNGHHWIGLKFDQSGQQIWVNGEMGSIPSLSSKGDKRCVTYRKKDGKFEVKKCTDKKKYVCQVGNSGVASTSTTNTVKPSPSISSLSQSTMIHPSTKISSSTRASLQEGKTMRFATSSKVISRTTTNAIKISSSISSPSRSTIINPSSKISSNTSASLQEGKTMQFATSSEVISRSTTRIVQRSSSISRPSQTKTPSMTHLPTRIQQSTPSNQVVNTQKIISTFSGSSPTNTVKPSTPLRQKGKKMIEEFNMFLRNLDPSDHTSMEDLLDEYDELMDSIDDLPMEEEDFNPLLEAQIIEHFAMEFTKMHLHTNQTVIEVTNNAIAYRAQVVYRNTNSNVVLPSYGEDESEFLSIPKTLLKDQEKTLIVAVVFKNDTIFNFTPSIFEESSNPKRIKVNTKIFSLNTYPKLKEPFKEGIVINHKLIQENFTKDLSRIYCSFWNYSIPSPYNGSWSKKGCSIKSLTATHAVCECNHVTNFAVLMQLKPENQVAKEHYVALKVITYVGLILSLLGETVTVICYCFFLNSSNDKIQIRINLLCTLAGAQIFILAGTNQTENKGVCVFVASVIHYLYLVSFCWMLMEGIYLYRMVVKVFDAELKIRFSYLFAYGCPVFLVALALFLAQFTKGGIYTYSNPNFCWVNFENKLIWSFVAPIVFIVTINSILLFCVIKEMFGMKTMKTLSSFEVTMIRASVRACVVLLPLLGITWVFGLLSLANIGIAWQYIFTILNTTQGLMIFIFHGVRNAELRTAISLRYHQWESNHSNHSNPGRVTPTQNANKRNKFTDLANSPCSNIPMATARANKINPNTNDVDSNAC